MKITEGILSSSLRASVKQTAEVLDQSKTPAVMPTGASKHRLVLGCSQLNLASDEQSSVARPADVARRVTNGSVQAGVD